MAKVGLGLGVLEGMIVNGGISIGVGDGEIAEVAASDSNLIHIKAFDLPKQGKSSF